MIIVNRVLILIPCCGSKRKIGETEYNANNSIFYYLNSSFKEHLLNLRRRLFEYFSIPFGRDISQQDDGAIFYLEANKRYTGQYSQIYRQISSNSWEKLRKTANLDLVIVSALYGLLRYDEPIRYYDKTMKNKIGNKTLKAWWRNNDLCAILEDYVNRNNISEIHLVLSNDYSEAIKGCFIDMKVKSIHYDFSEYKSGSNAYRGKWVEDFIQNF